MNEENTWTQLPRQKPSTHRLTAMIRDAHRKGHRNVASETGLSAARLRGGVGEASPPRTHSVIPLSPPDAQRAEKRTVNSFVDQSRLDHRLLIALAREPWTNRKFLPRGELDRLVTQRSLERELSRISKHSWRSSVKFGVEMPPEDEASGHGQTGQGHGDASTQPDGKYYQQVFAILLLIDRPQKIWSFVKEQVCDADLPLEDNMLDLRRRGKVTTALKCLRESFDIHRFLECQWYLLAPVFRKPNGRADQHIVASRYQVLPFTAWKDVGRQGGFAQVYKAEIHHDHHEFDANDVFENVVAVKRVRVKNRADFSRELSVLQHLGKNVHSHDHVVKLLASYEQHDYLCLILPWAEMDLAEYWETKDPRTCQDQPALSTWLREQCRGLAEVVYHIHRYIPFGRHGDIKPKNILWFPHTSSVKTSTPGLGTLKLSDFGTTGSGGRKSSSPQDSYTVPYSRSYQSPECRLPNAKLSAACDVWALGCVFLEFVCWYFGGYKLLQDFERQRDTIYGASCFFVINFAGSAELNPPVVEMIQKLQKCSAQNNELLDVLDIVKKDMLLIVGDT